MIPEIGQLALIIALCLSLIQTFFPLVGAHKGYTSWMAIGQARCSRAVCFCCFSLCLFNVRFFAG